MSLAPKQTPSEQTEKAFMEAFLQYARLQGFLCYHTFDARRSEPGFPDVCMTRGPFGNQPGRLIFVECKSHYGKVTLQQAAWLKTLDSAGAETYVWFPKDWPTIERTLARHP